MDSERILTQLKVEGCEIVGGYQEADLVVVDTCGFIEVAQPGSLGAVGEALAQNDEVTTSGRFREHGAPIRGHHLAAVT